MAALVKIQADSELELEHIARILFVSSDTTHILFKNSKLANYFLAKIPISFRNRVLSLTSIRRLRGKCYDSLIVYDFDYLNEDLLELLGYGLFITPFINESFVINQFLNYLGPHNYQSLVLINRIKE
jgi:hypothetical protein